MQRMPLPCMESVAGCPTISIRNPPSVPSSRPASEPENNPSSGHFLAAPAEGFLQLSPQPLCMVGLPSTVKTSHQEQLQRTVGSCSDGSSQNAIVWSGKSMFSSGSACCTASRSSSVSSSGTQSLEAPLPCIWSEYSVLPGGLATACKQQVDGAAEPASPPPHGTALPADVTAADLHSGALPQLDVLFSNDALSQLCGYSHQQLRRGGLAMLLQPPATASDDGCGGYSSDAAAETAEASSVGLQRLGAAITTGSSSRIELPCYHSSGRVLWCSLALSPVGGGGGGGNGPRGDDASDGANVVAAAGIEMRSQGSPGLCHRRLEPRLATGCGGGKGLGSVRCRSGSEVWAVEGVRRGVNNGSADGSMARRDSSECEVAAAPSGRLQARGPGPASALHQREGHCPDVESHPLQEYRHPQQPDQHQKPRQQDAKQQLVRQQIKQQRQSLPSLRRIFFLGWQLRGRQQPQVFGKLHQLQPQQLHMIDLLGASRQQRQQQQQDETDKDGFREEDEQGKEKHAGGSSGVQLQDLRSARASPLPMQIFSTLQTGTPMAMPSTQRAAQQQQQQQQQRFLVVFSDLTAFKQLQNLQQQQQHVQQQQQGLQQGHVQLQDTDTLDAETRHAETLNDECASAALELTVPSSTTPCPSPPLFSASATSPLSLPMPFPPSRSLSTDPRVTSIQPLTRLAAALSADDCSVSDLPTLALDLLGEGITVTDASAPDNPIIYTNRGFLSITGYSQEEVVGRNCRFLQGPDTDPAAVRAIHEAMSHRLPVTVQLLNYTKSGKAFWNQLRLEPVFAPGNSERLLAYIGVQNDVTELMARGKSEAALRDAKEAAESATEAKSHFLANMSHEIRTPLNGMIATAQLLLGSQLTPEQRELTETILESGSTLQGVLGDILDFSKIDHGSLELQRRPMCLRQATEACMDLVAAEAAKKGLALAYLMDDQVLSRPLLGDPVRIRQVLANLLSNAVKFTERGEVVVRVSVEGREAAATRATAGGAPHLPPLPLVPPALEVGTAVRHCTGALAPSTATLASHGGGSNSSVNDGDGGTNEGGSSIVHISVSDTGIGIGEESARKLFQHFRQGSETRSRRYGGTGLGLAISKRLAQLMDGDIWVESRLDVGSRFHFSLRAEWTAGEGPWPCSLSPSASSTPVNSSDCTPRSSTEEGNNFGGGAATATAAAALGVDSGNGGGFWSGSSMVRLSRSSCGSNSSSGWGGRELRMSPWREDGTPIDGGAGGVPAATVTGNVDVQTLPAATAQQSTAFLRFSGSGSSLGSGGGGGSSHAAGRSGEVLSERSTLLGRSVLIDVSHPATSTQIWNSCRQMRVATTQGNACALPLLMEARPLPAPQLLRTTAAAGAGAAAADVDAKTDTLAASSVLPAFAFPQLLRASSSAAAVMPMGPRVVQSSYDILVVSMDRLVPALKAGWKGRPIVVLGDRQLLPPALQPLVVVLAVPVRHSRLATALIKSTALLQWNGCSAPKLANTPIPSESIQNLKTWRLKRASDWEGANRRTSLDNSALERTNLMLRGAIDAVAAVAASGGGGVKSGLSSCRAVPGYLPPQPPIPEHAELLPHLLDDAGPLPSALAQAAGDHVIFNPSPQLPWPQQPSSRSLATTAAGPGLPAPATTPAGFTTPCISASVGLGQQQQKMRILVAEDNKVNQKVVLKVLQHILGNCQPPDVVENGLQVLQALQKKTYDLILMDIHMPEMDGLEASKRIQETYRPEERPRIIALSADTVQTLHDRCREAGIEAFLVKPFRIEDLARVMRCGPPVSRAS